MSRTFEVCEVSMYRIDLDNFVYRWDVLLSNDK